MVEFVTVDRRGKTVIVKPLSDNRIVFISQDGRKEQREIVQIKNAVQKD